MVQSFRQQSSYAYPWSECVQAFFLRYPNPQAAHVLTADVVDRRIEQRPPRSPSGTPSTVLCTSRLMLKRGSLPSWAPKNIIKNSESWVLEESEVDLAPPSDTAPRIMTIWTRNLDHTAVLAVTEGLRFTENCPEVSQNAFNASTACSTTADIRSDLSFSLLRRRIEKFGLKRYVAHKDTSREGLLWSIQHLEHLRHPSRALIPYTQPHPSRTKRLLHALRPPFLDGYPLGPVQWIKRRWKQWKEHDTGHP